MVQLTVEQRIFVVTKYHETKSFKVTREAFREAFPDRNPPAKSVIWYNVNKYGTEGTSHNLNKGRSGRPRTVRTRDNIDAVQQQLVDHPRETSARRNGLGLSSSSFSRITNLDLRFHPYQMHIRHQLVAADLERRQTFARWMLRRCRRNARFLESITVGDEAAFALNDHVNNHNVLEYAPKGQPRNFIFDVNMNRQNVSVWMLLSGNGVIIGPYFFDQNINGRTYLRMINEFVLPQLELNFQRQRNGVFRRLWWIQDGAPAHRLNGVRDRLQDLFGNRVIALNHDVEWPPRSPDLTPCDFFLWGYLKDRVYRTPPMNLQDLRDRIEQEVDLLRANPAMVRRAVADMSRRCQLCIDRGGGHVEGQGA